LIEPDVKHDRKRENDRLNQAARSTLRYGLGASLTCMVLGWLGVLFQGRMVPHQVVELGQLGTHLLNLQADGLLTLGILLLLATPGTCVAVLVLGLIGEHDWRHVAVGLGVILVLICSVLIPLLG